ncbi:MAG: serine/threonine-protein kinase [Singulisphaera sp.]
MRGVHRYSLDRVVRRKGPLSVAFACHYARQVALGLQHAYEQGMIHRDVKPQNLMLTPRGRIKILDFGIARLREEVGQATLTQPGQAPGTPDYMAPEQALSPHKVDIRADIYSLGCTLYYLMTGQPPYPGGTASQKWSGMWTGRPVRWPSSATTYPRDSSRSWPG